MSASKTTKKPAAKKAAAKKPAAKKPAAKKAAAKKPAAKKAAAAKKPAAKKPAAKKAAAKKPAAKKAAGGPPRAASAPPTVTDSGSLQRHLSWVLDLAGAPDHHVSDELATVEAGLGRPVPAELRSALQRHFQYDSGDHPKIDDETWQGKLPDVPAWLDQLRRPWEGTLHAIQHLLGLFQLGQQINRGDHMFAMAGLEAWGPLPTGGVFYYDEREMGRWGNGTVGGFLLQSLHELWKEADGERDGGDPDDEVEIDLTDLRDCFHVEGFDHRVEPPEAVDLAPPLAAAWTARAEFVTRRFGTIAMLRSVLAGSDRVWVAQLPTEEEWVTERDLVATSYPAAMFWLLAHWLCGNDEELADCAARTARHASPLVGALRAYVTTNRSADVVGPAQDKMLAAVRRAEAAS
ncbi:MAG: histone H1-like repetitive region-containing protein [Kofleriaceae bacterium]|nr:histone H1-like repetitive region-containing protein [Kofleriaceae bacterium]